MTGRVWDDDWFADATNLHYATGRAFPDGELLAAFAEIVVPLERASGKPLNGPGLRKCLRAFREDPEGFARLAAEALERGRNPLALLVVMVEEGQHRGGDPA